MVAVSAYLLQRLNGACNLNKGRYRFHEDQLSTLLNAKWCRQGTTFVRELCDLIGMVTTKAQINLMRAKQRFEEYLAAACRVNRAKAHWRRVKNGVRRRELIQSAEAC